MIRMPRNKAVHYSRL